MAQPSWTDISIANKLDVLRQLCIETQKPTFFPQTLEEFCEWNDETKALRKFSRPVIYKVENDIHRQDAINLMAVGQQRWTSGGAGDGTHIRELESLIKMLTSRYHQERQLRQDAEMAAAALRATVDSLTTKVRELTGSRNVKLVAKFRPEGG